MLKCETYLKNGLINGLISNNYYYT